MPPVGSVGYMTSDDLPTPSVRTARRQDSVSGVSPYVGALSPGRGYQRPEVQARLSGPTRGT